MNLFGRSRQRRAARASHRVDVAHRHRRFRLLGRLGFRARLTLAFTLGGLLLSALLAFGTLYLTRQILLDNRERSARRDAFEHAQVVSQALASRISLRELTLPNEYVVYQRDLEQFNADPEWQQSDRERFVETDIPQSLIDAVDAGNSAIMRTRNDDQPVLMIGIPLQIPIDDGGPLLRTQFYEQIPLDDIEDTLRSLTYIVMTTAGATAGLATVLGYWTARRTVRPLGDVAAAAEAIAGGRLDTRLIPPADRDLASLATSFNDMAGALQERIERDARFASEVSHELRSPLMTLTASVEVLETRRDELPERAQVAVDLLSSDLQRFKQLVADLLEISRFDVGTARLELDDLNVVEFTRQAVSRASADSIPIKFSASMADRTIRADKRRLAQVLNNLVDNAAKYGDGATSISLADLGDVVQIAVEDQGAGVPADERSVIFDRFSRGSAGGRRGSDSGVGLGLSLVAEHVHLHGGRVWVEDRADGEPGARFVVELPIVATETRVPR